MSAGDVGQALVQWHDQMGNPAPSPEAYEAAMQQGRQQQELQQQLAARDEQIRVQTEFRLRAETFARECSDFHETLKSVEGLDEGLSPVMLEPIRRSPVGPEVSYLLARDYWDPDTKGLIDHAISIANDPLAVAHMVGNWNRRSCIPGGRDQRCRRAQQKRLHRRIHSVVGLARRVICTRLLSQNSAEDYIAARRRG